MRRRLTAAHRQTHATVTPIGAAGSAPPTTDPADTRPQVQYHEGGSIQSRAIRRVARTIGRPVLSLWPLNPLGIQLMPLLDRAFDLLPDPAWAKIETVSGPGFRGELVRAKGATADGVILYFHGGAFLFCGLATHRRAVCRLSAETGMAVLSVDYRQLPAATLEESIADGVAAYDWLLDHGYDPHHTVLAGDSAGGHLAFAVAQRATTQGSASPAAIVAISPWLDLDLTAKEAHANGLMDDLIPVGRMARVAAMAAAGVMPIDPLMSPVNGELSHLPPVLIQVSDREVLLPDAELMAERLAAAGVPCTLQVWADQVHAFPVLANLTPESRKAISEIATFVDAAIRQAVSTSDAAESGALAG